MELQGEFRKIKPPHFDGEQEEVAKAWLINMNKYFQLYEYDHNLKARLAIFQLQGKATLWWEEIKIVKGVSERTITWEKFQKYFKERYLTERFYDEKAKEFHDLRLGQQSMDEFINRFTSLLRYVPYIKEEKGKVQRFVSNLPSYIRERIEFDNPRTMDEAIRKARICYQQNKQKGDTSTKRWNEKRSNRMVWSSKGGRSNGSKGVGKGLNNRSIAKSAPRARPISESRISEKPVRLEAKGDRPDIPELMQLWRTTKRNTSLLWLNLKELQGIKHPVQVRPITTSQLAKCIKKKCQIYAIQVGYANQKDKTAMLGNILVVQEFADVFPEEVPGLPPKRDVDFTIELIPGAATVSRAQYRMSVPELTEMKMQL
eukprot:PITA_15852